MVSHLSSVYDKYHHKHKWFLQDGQCICPYCISFFFHPLTPPGERFRCVRKTADTGNSFLDLFNVFNCTSPPVKCACMCVIVVTTVYFIWSDASGALEKDLTPHTFLWQVRLMRLMGSGFRTKWNICRRKMNVWRRKFVNLKKNLKSAREKIRDMLTVVMLRLITSLSQTHLAAS